MTQFKWTSASFTHVGLVRARNEDAFLDQAERGIWAVADGMGGHAFGDLASRRVVEGLARIGMPDSLVKFVADVRDTLQAVNRQLRVEAANHHVQIIGSTVVVLLARHGYCAYLWAGDSRIYLCRNGKLIQLTRDHSQLEELKASGNLSSEDMINLPSRGIITRAVGAASTLDLDSDTMETHDGDMFLLCSDGLSNEVSEQEMCSALVPGDCQQASDALIAMALQRGGHDNISAVVVRIDDIYSADKTVVNPAL